VDKVRFRWYIAVGLVLTSTYWLVPAGLAQDFVYLLLGASCVGAIGYGVRHYRPVRRAPWVLMGLGQLLWVIGDAVSSWYADVAHNQEFPSPADAFYLAAYPILAVGLLLLVRGGRPRRDVAGALDSAILTAGLGLLSWVLLAHPTIEASQYSVSAAVVGAAYPVADILLVGVLIRMATSSGGRTPAFRLLLVAVLLLIAGDSTSAALSLFTDSSTRAYDVIWLASYVAWGAAALHPSMVQLSEPTLAPNLRLTRARLAALGAATMIAPGTLAVQRLIHVTVDVWAVVIGAVVLFSLVVARMNVAINQIVAANRDRDRLQTNLAYQAAHDSLTNLPNRAQAMHDISAALHRAQRAGTMVGLLFVDLDGFKAVNDTFGHGSGDDVLRTIAQRLQDEVRAGDMVARLGGDEFIVLLESLSDESDAVHIASRVIDVAGEPITVELGRWARVGASVGVAISKDGSIDPDRLLREADAAVYRAKAGGRGRVEIFDAALRRELAERARLEAALTKAIERDQLVVHYQPVVDLTSSEVIGYEALVRWQRPGYGLVGPGDFIPTAEASNLICELDTWVLQHATAQLATWTRAAGPSRAQRTVAVNLSGRHLSRARVVDDVREALELAGLPAHQLVVEITETALLEDLRAIDHLQQLRALGVSVSIDDFGTGYSSIARLQTLPIDIIKIDRSFLDDANPSSFALLQLMIGAAHAFHLPVIAEGVEHPDQLDILRRLDCEAAQGFYLSRPLPAEEAERYTWPVAAHAGADALGR
jgi:diguanylate cyclase (GGDEF)-like protein